LKSARTKIDEQKAKKMVQDFYYSKGYDDTMFAVETLREKVERDLKEEKNMLKLLTGFSLICILMTIMTIVGLSSYHSKTTEKDNAIRNVFGCSKKELIRNITLSFVLPVVISAAVAIPIAYTVIGRWLEGYVIRTDNSPIIYAGAFAVVIVVVITAILLQAMRMTRTNPAEALKKE
jgi:putative ABC transport system permease protein